MMPMVMMVMMMKMFEEPDICSDYPFYNSTHPSTLPGFYLLLIRIFIIPKKLVQKFCHRCESPPGIIEVIKWKIFMYH